MTKNGNNMKNMTKSGNAVKSNTAHISKFYLFVKRTLDITISLAALIVLSPFFIIFAVIVFLNDFHNPFYLHERVGRNGKKFNIIKFRSMYWDSHDLDKYFNENQMAAFGAEYKLDDDPRITPIGKIIRKFSIDELPQIINVLLGQMSIVGPRPLTEEETYFFGDDRDALLSIKPGITGLWQVSGRNALTYESGKRQECELKYVNNVSFKTDFIIILKTFKAVFGGSGM